MEQTAGRTGITFEQVAAVADTIAARGDRATLRGVRADLGTGSMGTIQKHLAAWQSSRRQIVTSAASLPTEIQRVILSEIERSISEARAELEGELAATKGDRDALADDNESQAEQIDLQAGRLAEIEATSQQQAGRIGQLGADLAVAWEATERERGVAEQARQALAKAELRLESLPKVEAEAERLRAALESERQAKNDAEQRAAVLVEKLTGIEARLADAQGREQQIAAKFAESENCTKAAERLAEECRYRRLDAEAKNREAEKEMKATAAALDAERKAKAVADQRAIDAELQAAELRGKLATIENVKS